jgi:hypothetical protein
MLRQDDPEAKVAERTLTETEAGTLPALALRCEREHITMIGHEERSRLMQLDTGWLRRALILFTSVGLAGQLSPVSA